MSGSGDDEQVDIATTGCCLLFVVLTVVGLILTFWLQILLISLAAGAVYLLFLWVKKSAREAEERRRCPVCGSWSGSVILAEFDDPTMLCPSHAARWGRINGLEGDVLHGG